jgi:hypothetical protein
MPFITNTVRQSKKLFITSSLSLLLGGLLLTAPMASALTIGGPSDCDSNAIINCGAHSTSALMGAYQSSAYVQKVYAYFGISASDMANLPATNVAGRVTRDGKVFVDGQSQAVATNAVTGGRQNMPGSTQVNFQGVTFFKRPPSVSFQQQSLPAFVAMKNGQFQFAVIASCGNAVRAQAVKQPPVAVGQAQAVSKPQPKPQPAKPAPTQTQSQTQSQSQTVNVNNSNTTTVQNTTTQPQPAAPASPEQPAAQAVETQPSKLVNTGPASIVGIFVVASLAGAYGFRRFLTHRFNNYLTEE